MADTDSDASGPVKPTKRAPKPAKIPDDDDDDAGVMGGGDDSDASMGGDGSDGDDFGGGSSDDDVPKKKAKKATGAAKESKSKSGAKGKAAGGKKAPKAAAASNASSAAAGAKRPLAAVSNASTSTAVRGVPVPTVKPATEKEAEVVLVEYLNRANRPFSAINVFDNLHGLIGKTVLPRMLDKLAEEGRIVAKTYGKFRLYWASQAQYGEISTSDVDAEAAAVAAVEAHAATVAAKKKELSTRVATLSNAMSAAELAKALGDTKSAVSEMRAKLERIKGGGTPLVSPAERAAVKKALDKYVKAWKERKRAVMDAVGMISEGMERKVKDVVDEIGVETDEAHGVNIRDFT